VIAEKIVNQKAVGSFVSGEKKISYIASFTSLAKYNIHLLNKPHIEL
jgi:hypothetical protein